MKKWSSKVLSLFLALVMICSFTLSSVRPVVTYAQGDGEGENQEKLLPGGQEDSGLDEDGTQTADPFAVHTFYDLYETDDQESGIAFSENATVEKYEKKVFTIGPWKEHLAEPYMDYGVLVKAKQDQVPVEEGQSVPDPTSTVTVTLKEEFDFGEDVLNRVEFNGLAKSGSKAKVEVLLDDEAEPIGSMTMYNQTAKDDWRKNKGYSFDVSAAKISGKHKVSLRIQNAGEKLEVLIRSVQFVQESIPVVNLSIDESKGTIKDMNADPTHATECYGKMSIHIPEEFVADTDPEGTFVPEAKGYKLEYIRGRGNSTWTVDKKPYKMKLDKKADFFHMGQSKHWTLLANYYDNSLVRNRMTYQLGKELGYQYTPECVSVDVVMNGEYLGNYLLCEQVRVEESRVNIADLEQAYDDADKAAKGKTDEEAAQIYDAIDLTGGYLISNSPYGGELGYGFVTPKGNSFYLESPESEYDTTLNERTGIGDYDMYAEDEELSDEEGDSDVEQWEDTSRYAKANAYITDYINEVEDAIYAEDFIDPDSESYKKVADMMNIDSAVQYYWMQELSMNGDGFVCPSTYLYKEKDTKDAEGNVVNGKLYWGPLWDFDYVAWGSTDYSNYDEGGSYEGFELQRVWFERLLENPDFSSKVKAYWTTELYPAIKKVIAADGTLDQYGKELAVSANNNFQKWGFTPLGFGEDDNYYGDEDVEDDLEGMEEDSEESEEEQTYVYEINRLKSWIQHRAEWIDENINMVAPTSVDVIFMNDGKEFYKTTGYSNREFNDFPEDPEPSEEGMVFVGWNYSYTYVDEEDGEEYEDTCQFGYGEYISEELLNEDGQLILTAEFLSEDEWVDADNIIFEKKDYYMLYSKYDYYQVDLKYMVLPLEANRVAIDWSSSNPDVAIVENGCVISTGAGDAVITATLSSGKEFSTNVHVIDEIKFYNHYEDYILEDFYMEQESMDLQSGEGQKIDVVTEPAEHIAFDEENEFIWFSSDEAVASVNDMGYVTANGPGTATIIAYNSETRTMRMCTVTVDSKTPSKGDSDDSEIHGSIDKNQPNSGTKPGTGNNNATGNATGNHSGTEINNNTTVDSVKVGTIFTVKNLNYKVTACKDKDLQVEVTGVKKSKTTVSIPATVKYKSKTYSVTAIAKKAFAKDKKLKTLKIGKNVTSIGSKACDQCKKLKNIKVDSKVLKKVGKNAFKGIAKKANVKVPKTCKKAYKKLFKGLKIK